MKIIILSLFPEFFRSFFETSLIKKAIHKNTLSFEVINIRDFALDQHHRVDDEPYGGGAGMVMKVEPLYLATQQAKEILPNAPVILMSPRGERFSQKKAAAIAAHHTGLILVCGRYEGIDERYTALCVDEEISLGDFVLMGGEVAALAITEAIVRLIPDVLGNEESTATESFSPQHGSLLEAPQYTRPPEFMDQKVPEVLMGGNHDLIQRWRQQQSEKITSERRPDILKK